MTELIHFENRDCVEAMKEFPDKFFDLAIVDPPYGIGVCNMPYTKEGSIKTKNAKANRRDYRKENEWDEKPTKEYFDQLKRVSKKYIIWGGITSRIFYRHQKDSSVGIRDALTQW